MSSEVRLLNPGRVAELYGITGQNPARVIREAASPQVGLLIGVRVGRELMVRSDSVERYMTLAAAAERLGLAEQPGALRRVRILASGPDARLAAIRIGGVTLITRESLERLILGARRGGRAC